MKKAASGAMWVLNTTKKIAKLVKTNVRNRESDDRENEKTKSSFSKFSKEKERERGKIEEEEELQDRETVNIFIALLYISLTFISYLIFVSV